MHDTPSGSLLEYFFASVLLGGGIAIDVALATVAMRRLLHDRRTRRFWVLGVTSTHVVFPMVGYYGFAYFYRAAPTLHAAFGVMASLLIAIFLFKLFEAWVRQPEDQPARGYTVTLGAIVAVSWDALWSGPAKSAQAIVWSPIEIFLSFIIAGAIVGLIAWLTTSLVTSRATGESRNLQRIGPRFVSMTLEFAIILYFGVLAIVRYVVESDAPWPYVLMASVLASAALFLVFHREIIRHIKAEIAGEVERT